MEQQLSAFEQRLREEEKSAATISKYVRDVKCFFAFLAGRTLEKDDVIAYKAALTARYAPASVNSMLIALNRFLRFIGRTDCCVRPMYVQRQMFCDPQRELSCREYQRLVRAAKGTRLCYVLQTLCGTCLPARFTAWTRTSSGWRTFWDTAASTPRASTPLKPARPTAGGSNGYKKS